ncbi:ABC transporter ATP-binding protein [Anaerobacillus alkaliphilus]|uniref:ABC transporter ATP-binding protein n=1 Tax=Anaerobacillus alkaliphilus TaxID=1548597 RepID=A0A4Q0VW48_9BACI|nr:ABC transporter ATP-binding protein [Anaerobacillus alkaliphilus]RXJ02361.1 ABC transporter ATP-binding protein [Anaerobacillus alkaliphilus]
MKLVEVNNLKKIFDNGEQKVEVLKGITTSIDEGQIVAIMGPSGCGKTTLLNTVSGIDTISAGEVFINGVNLHKIKAEKRDEFRANAMGFVFQSYNLIPVLTAVENVELPLLCQGMSGKLARKKAEAALVRVGLKERKNHRPSELSGGQQQRVALARAIVNEPKVVWADEPTGALDRETTEMVLDLIDHLNRVDGITFVIVTHDPKVAERAHRILYMDSGVIIQERTSKTRPIYSERRED